MKLKFNSEKENIVEYLKSARDELKENIGQADEFDTELILGIIENIDACLLLSERADEIEIDHNELRDIEYYRAPKIISRRKL